MRRFTIRALLILTACVAMLCAMPHGEARRQHAGRKWVAAQRGHITFKYAPDTATKKHSIPYVPNFMVSLFGVDYFNPVTGVILDCEELSDLEPIAKMESLEAVVINIEMADDISLDPLLDLPHLRQLHFTQWSRLTDEQFAMLQERLPYVMIFSDNHSTSLKITK